MGTRGPSQKASANAGPSRLNPKGCPPTPPLMKRSDKPYVLPKVENRKGPQANDKKGGPSKLGRVPGRTSSGG